MGAFLCSHLPPQHPWQDIERTQRPDSATSSAHTQRAACTARVVSSSGVRAMPAPPVQQPDPEEGRGLRGAEWLWRTPRLAGECPPQGCVRERACTPVWHTSWGCPQLPGSGCAQGQESACPPGTRGGTCGHSASRVGPVAVGSPAGVRAKAGWPWTGQGSLSGIRGSKGFAQG